MAKLSFGYTQTGLRVCLDSVQDGNYRGMVYSQLFSEPIQFAGLGDMILKVDEAFDKLNYPQGFMRIRSFREQKKPKLDEGPRLSAEVADAAFGACATFILRVATRSRATWQGVVNWLDGTAPVPFGSELELLQLIEKKLNP